MKGQSWLCDHLESFIKPQLGYIPTDVNAPLTFTKDQMSVIKNLWRSIKQSAIGKTLVLPGRDVFVFEILARRENYPTIFLPGCSRASVEYFKNRIPTDSFVFDTGFMGTIPTKLDVGGFKLVSYNKKGDKKQVFPRLTHSRGLALDIEKTPKYWQTGRLVDGKLVQEYSSKEEFERAAILTMQIYKDSSPSFVNKRQPLGGDPWKLL